MRSRLYLGAPWGIPVYLHFTFFLVFALAAWRVLGNGGTYLEALVQAAFVIPIYLCVVLHEYGHALTARHFGIGTREIILLPIGGIAQIERSPKTPRQELLITAAGPAVNVVIALLMGALFVGIYGNPFPLTEAFEDMLMDNIILRLLLINVGLAVFNLVPAFPMDGGRLLRAGLTYLLGYQKATLIAVRIGQTLGLAFAGLGIYEGEFVLTLVGLFVVMGASSELKMARREKLGTLGGEVATVMDTNPILLSPEDTVSMAINKLGSGLVKDMIVARDGYYYGILPYGSLMEAVSQGFLSQSIATLTRTEISSLHPITPINVAMELLEETGLSLLPVVLERQVVGAFAPKDNNS